MGSIPKLSYYIARENPNDRIEARATKAPKQNQLEETMKTEKYAKPGFHPSSSEECSPARRTRQGGAARTRHCTHPDREARRKAAQERQEEYNKLTLQQKLDRAISRGHEESKEAKRLRAQMAAQQSQPAGEGAQG